jgi:hypothetical protein
MLEMLAGLEFQEYLGSWQLLVMIGDDISIAR